MEDFSASTAKVAPPQIEHASADYPSRIRTTAEQVLLYGLPYPGRPWVAVTSRSPQPRGPPDLSFRAIRHPIFAFAAPDSSTHSHAPTTQNSPQTTHRSPPGHGDRVGNRPPATSPSFEMTAAPSARYSCVPAAHASSSSIHKANPFVPVWGRIRRGHDQRVPIGIRQTPETLHDIALCEHREFMNAQR